ncbi:MAG TPA: putative glycoside hydrolase [Hyphomicrobiales bacterium]|nr:putative glycoside hydrolase [Hyphomicrobiales bacterium]
MRIADIPFEKYSESPTPTDVRFMNRRFDRMMVYRPYFDSRLAWYPRAWFYQNAYALYPEAAVTRAHPEWVLRDAEGRRLYIPWGCHDGTCPAFAANILDPAFRAWWIETAGAGLAKGYRGIFVDDVSLTERVSDGAGKMVPPIDPVTGRPIDATLWAEAMDAFVEQIRAAFPTTEIVHNSVWFYDTGHDHKSPLLHRQIAAADYSLMEFGVADGGITGGDGPFSLAQLMRYVDVSHGLGRPVILGGTPGDRQGRGYALGCYLLVADGRDLILDDHVTPADPAPVYQVPLGRPLGPRFRWHGGWRRDFSGGSVVVNEPDASPLPLDGLGGRQWDGAPLPPTLAAKAAVIALR